MTIRHRTPNRQFSFITSKFRPLPGGLPAIFLLVSLILLDIVMWTSLLLMHVSDAMPGNIGYTEPSVGTFTYRLVLAGFFVAQTLLWGRIFTRNEKFEVVERLWKLFFVGMMAVVGVLIVLFLLRLTNGLTLMTYFPGALFCFGLFFYSLFLVGAVFTFQRFILYPRTKRKLWFWNAYLVLLAFSVLLLFDQHLGEITRFRYWIYGPMVAVVIYLVVQVKWVSYLNFTQKLRALGLIFLILVIQIVLLTAAWRYVPDALGDPWKEGVSLEFLNFLVSLSLGYSLSSLLVLFFTLPTTSLFEQKSFEIASFNKINHAIQSKLDFSDIIDTLLNVCLYTSDARAWFEIWDPEKKAGVVKVAKRLTLADIAEIKGESHYTAKVMEERKYHLIRNMRRGILPGRSPMVKYRSLLVVPVFSGSEFYGAIHLAAEPVNAFEEFNIQSVLSYAEQTGIALENAKLVKESIENERFREQFKIAKEIQQGLLPSTLPQSPKVDFAGFAQSAYEVGGDYYDIFQRSPSLYRIAIGDVSGKGTKAAFHMAEVKGIFQALSQLNISVRDFILNTNRALAACLQKGSFLTLTYLELDTDKRSVELLRAGHCPTLWYRRKNQCVEMLSEGTLGLGIIRDDSFESYLGEPTRLEYEPGDMLVLFTDGIPETRNEQNEEFGFQRIEQLVKTYGHESALALIQRLVLSVQDFASKDLDDDVTMLVIKLKD